MTRLRGLLRAALFYLLLIGWTLVYGIAAVPFLLAPRSVRLAIARRWNRGVVWMIVHIAGIRYEVRGHVPEAPAILAVKHQSAFETLALPLVLGDPAFVLKRELFWIPLFGWYLESLGNIGIDRGAGPKALRAILGRAERVLKSGRHVVIFPEGTRVAPGKSRPYGPGVAALYSRLSAPVVPVALNSGLYWRRRAFAKTPGTVTIEFLPPVPSGLDREAFMAELKSRIETATARLLQAPVGG